MRRGAENISNRVQVEGVPMRPHAEMRAAKYGLKPVSRVRIPLSPPFLLLQTLNRLRFHLRFHFFRPDRRKPSCPVVL